MAFPWSDLIGGGLNLLSNSQTQKIESSNNATAVSIAQLNNQSALANSQMLSKVLPLGMGAIALVVVGLLVLKKK